MNGFSKLSDADLRKRAEEIADERLASNPSQIADLTLEKTKEMLHELLVHQIELEMQNEELRRIQLVLDATKARYFNIYDLAPIGYLILSPKGLILESNITFTDQVDVSRRDLVGRNFFEFIFAEDREIYYLHNRQLYSTQNKQSFKLRIVKRNQANLWVHLETTFLLDEDGAPTCRAAIIDIADAKNAETMLVENEERYRTLFESMPIGVFFISPDGAMLFANTAAEKILGISHDEFLRLQDIDSRFKSLAADGSPFQESSLPSTIAMSTGQVVRGVVIGIFNQRENKYHWVNSSAIPLFHPGDSSPYQVYVTLEDVTDLVQAEKDLKKTESEILELNTKLEGRVLQRTKELLAANTELEAFGYSVSHDLRTPLRNIAAFNKLFLDEFGTVVPEKGRKYLEYAGLSAQHMLDLIDALLNLSHVISSQLSMKRIDLSVLAAEVTKELAQEYPHRDVQLAIEPGMTIWGDVNLVRILLTNLLGNAWKFTSKREHAQISVGRVNDPKHGSAFFVRDNGVGFNEKYKKKLFLAFQRLHSDSDFPGTGIGLAIVARIVHRHGGEVSGEGKVDEGATIYFTLPGVQKDSEFQGLG